MSDGDQMIPDDPTQRPPSGLDDDAAQRAAVELMRGLDEVVAPDRLHAAIAAAAADAARARSHGRRRFQWRLGGGLALAGGLATALVVVLAVGGGGDGGSSATPPRVRAVAQVALRPATVPAPAAAPGGKLLRAHAGPVAFPTWHRAGWSPTGARSDTVGGHTLKTVFYAGRGGWRIGYAIADARLPVAGGQLVERHGAQIRVLARGATAVVTWERDGYTCILAGRGVPVDKLVTLASYAA
jgi:hypothetical protein